MSLIRLFHWTCDICGTKAEKQGYGFPKGWTSFILRGHTGAGTRHACSRCARDHSLSPKGTSSRSWSQFTAMKDTG